MSGGRKGLDKFLVFYCARPRCYVRTHSYLSTKNVTRGAKFSKLPNAMNNGGRRRTMAAIVPSAPPPALRLQNIQGNVIKTRKNIVNNTS